MRYQVIEGFYDLEDDWRRYEAGDTYPRPGLTPTEARAAFLAGDENRLGHPVIRAVEAALPSAKLVSPKAKLPTARIEDSRRGTEETPKRKRGKPDA